MDDSIESRVLEVLRYANDPLTAVELATLCNRNPVTQVDTITVIDCLLGPLHTQVTMSPGGRWALRRQQKRERSKRDEKPAQEKRSRFRWATCRECGHRTHVRRHELERAAPPRCTACGGIVDLSEEGRDEQAGYHDVVKAKIAEMKRKQQP